MSKAIKSLLGRCVRSVWEHLVFYGTCMAGVPAGSHPGQAPLDEPVQDGVRTQDISPRHPERLCPEIPLTLVEQRLQAELRGLF